MMGVITEVKKTLKVEISPREFQNCHQLKALHDLIQSKTATITSKREAKRPLLKDHPPLNAIYQAWPAYKLSLWEDCSPCDWLFQYDFAPNFGEAYELCYEHLIGIFYAVVRDLVKAHPPLRACPLDRPCLNDAIESVWGLYTNEDKILTNAMKTLWPKCLVKADATPNFQVRTIHEIDFLAQNSDILKFVENLRREHNFVNPATFTFFGVKQAKRRGPNEQDDEKRPQRTRAFYRNKTKVWLYVQVSHFFNDGYCVNPIHNDLETLLSFHLKKYLKDFKYLCKIGSKIYNKESPRGINELVRVTPEMLPTNLPSFPLEERNVFLRFEERVRRSLNCEIFPEFCKPSVKEPHNSSSEAWVRSIRLETTAYKALAMTSKELGISKDVVLIGCVVIAFSRHLKRKKIPLNLMHTLRDQEGDLNCLGFLSEYQDMGLLPCHEFQTIIGLFIHLHNIIRNRKWQIDFKYAPKGRYVGKENFPLAINFIPLLDNKNRDDVLLHVPTKHRLFNADQSSVSFCHIYIEELVGEYGIRLKLSKEIFSLYKVVELVDELQKVLVQVVEGDFFRKI